MTRCIDGRTFRHDPCFDDPYLETDIGRCEECDALSVFPTYKQRALGITTESAREALMQELVKRIMGPPESEAVILEPSNAGPIHAPWRGKWGVDEPHPMDQIQSI